MVELTNARVRSPEDYSSALEDILTVTRIAQKQLQFWGIASRLERGYGFNSEQRVFGKDEIFRLMADQLSEHARVVGYGKEVSTELSDGRRDTNAVRCRSDRYLLEMLFFIVIDNAFKFSEPGGVVQGNLFVESQCLRLMIANRGLVLHPKDVKHVTKKYWRSSGARLCATEGRGIGLWVAREIEADPEIRARS